MSLTKTNRLIDEIDSEYRHYIDGIKIRTKNNLNSEAVDAERVLTPFINRLYNIELSNRGIEDPRNDTIDLHDPKRRICFQVTANNSKTKVKHTTKLFIEKEKYHLYDELHFLILDRERSFNYDEDQLKEFNTKIVFHDSCTIFSKLRELTIDEIKPIHDFVMSELSTL